MRTIRRYGASTALLILCLASAGQAEEQQPAAGSLSEALQGATSGIDLRYRYEHVDQDSFSEDADASTVRLRLNAKTGSFRRWHAFAEVDYVAELLVDDFNDGSGNINADRLAYPVVADPDGTDLNQLYFDYAGTGGTALRIGRQRILLDNQRFVGGVGWRQNEQTYDGLSVFYNGLARTRLQYSYIWRVNRIFGDRSPAGSHSGGAHLLHGDIDIAKGWSVAPYAYLIDNDDAPAFSTTTLGARASGRLAVAGKTAKVSGEFATQSDASDAPVGFRANYVRIDATMQVRDSLSLTLGFESLGGDNRATGRAFRTPLATLHAFQGWADQFLATPDAGIDDLFVSATYSFGDWVAKGVWHDLTAESGLADWGTEVDLSLERRFGDRYGLLLKAARFDADSPAFSDVSKYWLMLTASY